MKQPIIGYHVDGNGDWLAELRCGHNQHVHHSPPWIRREWVMTKAGRAKMLGVTLECRKCDDEDAPDRE